MRFSGIIIIVSLVALALLYWQDRLPAWLRPARFIKKLPRYSGFILIFMATFLTTRNLILSAAVSLLVSIAVKNSLLQKTPPKPSRPPPSPPLKMALMEAYGILKLRPGAHEDEVLAAYRALMKLNHPDHGGSTDTAAKLNEAKAIILDHLRQDF